MKYDITHAATIAQITGNIITLSVTPQSACGECRVKNLCGMGEEQEKLVSVHDPNPEVYSIGDEVVVGIGTAMGIKAAAWAYMVPFVVMIASLVVCSSLGMSDLASGLVTLGVAALYFICLWPMRQRLEKEIIFKIIKI